MTAVTPLPQPIEPTAVYRRRELARLLGISPTTLDRWPIRRRRLGPRTVVYLGRWVLDYLEQEAA